MMKRLTVLILALLMLLSATACSVQTRQNKILTSVGEYKSKQLWSHGEFQDYTDFGIYAFSAVNVEDNAYFSAVAVDDVETICAFIDNFEKWIETFKNNDPDDDLVLNYSFDRSAIDIDDYFYIYERENYPKYGCYDLYFFDTQTNKLYYFHNNI